MSFDIREFERLKKFSSSFTGEKKSNDNPIKEPFTDEMLTDEMLTDELFLKMMFELAHKFISPVISEYEICKILLNSVQNFKPQAIVLSNYMALHLRRNYTYSEDIEPFNKEFTKCNLFGLPCMIFHNYNILPTRNILLIKTIQDSMPASFSIVFDKI